MLQRCARFLASPEAGGGKYLPRFRPRRVVMPVDPSDVHSSRRHANRLYTRSKDLQRLQRRAERRGAIKLADVPAERSVGDAFRLMLEGSREAGLFRPFHSPHLKELHDTVTMLSQESAAPQTPDGPGAASSLDGLALQGHETNSPAAHISAVDSLWDLLNRTSLAAPAHGALVLRGKALTESILLSVLQAHYPRLRSRHLQQYIHECCGLLPCGQAAQRLGLAGLAGVEAEIGMWRELNVLTGRLHEARLKAALHRERAEKGITQQRRWYWRAVLKSASGRLKLFPVDMEDIKPRMEWLRNLVFAFVAFLRAVELSGEPSVRTTQAVLALFAPSLLRFTEDTRLLQRAAELVEGPCAGPSGDGLRHELQRVGSLTAEELAVINSPVHPLNAAADRRRHQLEASGGAHAVEALRDDLEEEHHESYAGLAPPSVVHCTRVPSALKEAQLILRYAPRVHPALRSGGINVEQVIRRTVEVHETNPYASLTTGRQQFRPVEYTVCRLFSGPHGIGEGKGESLPEAMQMAAQDMVTNYYVRGAFQKRWQPRNAVPSAGRATDGEIHIGEAVVEEQLHF
eukprot:gene9186-6463_t